MPANTIRGWGYATAATPISNADLLTCQRHEGDLLRETGVSTRYHATPQETPSTLGAAAAHRALAVANLAASDLGAIIATCTLGDRCEVPPTACLIQGLLNAGTIPAFTISGGASTFCTALMIARALTANVCQGAVLVVGTETCSRFLGLGLADRIPGALFGDGAGALVLDPATGPRELLGVVANRNVGDPLAVCIPAGGSRLPTSHQTVTEGLHYLQWPTPSDPLYAATSAAAAEAAITLCDEQDVSMRQLARVIPSTPVPTALKHLERCLAAYGLPPGRIFCPLGRFGDLLSASLPLALADTANRGLLSPGDLILLVALEPTRFGLTLLRW